MNPISSQTEQIGVENPKTKMNLRIRKTLQIF